MGIHGHGTIIWEKGEIKQRLDRGLGTNEWVELFEKKKCTHIESLASDHSILLLDTMSDKKGKKKKRFFFDKRWIQKEGIKKVVKEAWGGRDTGSRMFRLVGKVKKCIIALLKWKNKIQFNAKKRINQIKELAEKEKQTEEKGKRGRVAALKIKLHEAYKEEEQFWSQKARLQ